MTRSEFEEKKADIESRYKGNVRDIQLKKLIREYAISSAKDAVGEILGLFNKSKITTCIIISFIVIVTALSACFSVPSSDSGTNEQTTSRTSSASKVPFTGNGGKGIVIAVPAPALRGAGSADSWLPQFFQDRITGDLARFSAMTVLDRANESLAIAEQKLSETGFYSDNDMVELGNMTNARYIVAGNIQNTGGIYAVSFRINDIETNVIQASFSGRYGKTDMENGKAAKEAVRELLAGMGIELTEEGEKTLLAIRPVDVRATAQLARGVTAEKNGNDIEALSFFIQAVESRPGMKEAESHIQNFTAISIGASIRERANYAMEQKAKWEKIFKDLRKYLDDNLVIVVYDLSVIKDKISSGGSGMNVSFKISPGVKIIPNRTALLVYKRVMDEWERIRKMEENKSWAGLGYSSVQGTQDVLMANRYDSCYVRIGLYDEYGDCITTTSVKRRFSYGYDASFQVIAQHKYYDDQEFMNFNTFSVPVKKISSDIITPKIIEVGSVSNGNSTRSLKLNPPIMTVAEWRDWLSQQGTAR